MKPKHSTYTKFHIQRSIKQFLDVGTEFTILSVGFLLGKLKIHIMSGDTKSRGVAFLGSPFWGFLPVSISPLSCKLTMLQSFISSIG